MKFSNKVLASALLAMSVSAVAQAADEEGTATPVANQGQGTVKFTGSIIDAPCSISPETVDQVVELGVISNAALKADNGTGSSAPQDFSIELENCTFETATSVAVTFSGAKTDSGKLGITGKAEGAGIVIMDKAGSKPIKLGEASSASGLQPGNNALLFSAYLQGEGKPEAIVPGDFTGVTDFTLSYE